MRDLSPFKFLDSYTKNDRDIFFGREAEVEELYSKVFQSRILLVYGASGTGKSSIINCGLANKFLETDWLPISIRRGENINQSMSEQLQKSAINPINDQDSILKTLSNVYLDHFKPIYLIFDQFEELFIFGEKEEWQTFIQSVNEIISNDSNTRFVFIIRGEYLEFLSEFEEMVPDFFNNRMRIEKITRQKAYDCIEGPCNLFSINLEENFVENLLKKLSPDKTEIELTFLQVFLDRIYQTAETRVNGVTRTYFTNQQIEDLGEIGDVLADFLEAQLQETENPELTLAVLKSFVSMEGTKAQNTIEDVVRFSESIGQTAKPDRIESVIHDLVNRRILKDKDEADRYEFRHDSLALKIFEKITQQERELLDVKQFIANSLNEYKKRGVLLDEKDLAYIAHYEDRLITSEEVKLFLEECKQSSKKKRRSRRRLFAIITIIILLMITSVLGFFNSQTQKTKAEEMAKIANAESERSKELQGQAENQRAVAEASAIEAERQSELAMSERERAEMARQEAEQQRILAINAQNQAVSEAESAKLARSEAELNAQEAEKQKIIADRERSNANQLYMLALARTMGIKSTQISDRETSALVGLQAYNFNQQFSGNPYQPEIYTALFEATERYFGEDYNAGTFHGGAVRSISSNDQFVYSTGSDGQILQWSLNDHKFSPKVLANTEHINHQIALSADSKFIAVSTDEGYVYQYSAGGELIKSQKQHNSDVVGLAFTPSGHKMYSLGEEGKIYYWTEDEIRLLVDLKEKTNAMALNSDGSKILIACASGKIISVDNSGNTRTLYSEKGTQASAVAYANNSNMAVFGFENGKVMVWDLNTNQISFNLTGHTAQISQLKFNKEDNFLISTSFDRSARVWKMDQLQEQPIVLADHGSWISAVGFSPDGKGVVLGEFNQKVRFYPFEMSGYADELCKKIKRNMTTEEWAEFVAESINYEQTCKSITP